MPSDANGVYSLPTGYLAVTGEDIEASQHNPPLEDLAAAATARLMRSGAGPMTGPIKLTDGTAANPAATFASDEGLGIRKTTRGLGVSVGGQPVGEFTSHGLVGSAPVGSAVMWFVNTLPEGWTWANGLLVPVADNPILFSMFAYNWGGTGANMAVPNLCEVIPIGRGTMGGAPNRGLLNTVSDAGKNNVGSLFGTETHTLDRSQIPQGITSVNLALIGLSVTSVLNDILRGGSSDNFTSTAGTGQFDNLTKNQITSTGSIPIGGIVSTSNNTGGAAHNNLQPALVVNWIIRLG